MHRKLPSLVLVAVLAVTAAARADSLTLNQPIASQREITVFLVDNGGTGVSGLSVGGGLVLQIAKSGANWTTPGATIAEVTGGPPGSYRLSFTTGDVDTLGDMMYAITKAGAIKPYVDRLRIEPHRGSLDYNQAQGGAAGSITLASAASSIDSYYAGSGKGCIVQVVAGPGAGQARLCTGYTGSSRQLAVSPSWVTTPTSSSVYDVLPYTGQLDATQVAAIQSGLATDAHVLAIPTTPLLTGDTRLNHLDADITSRASSSAVAAIPTNPVLTSDARIAHLDADVSSRATDAHVLAIPTTPLLTSDARLNDLDATISSRSTQTSVNAIPTTPLLTGDSRLSHLDADVSSRVAPTVPGRTLAIATTGQAGIDWGNIANPTTSQNLSATLISGGGGGGGGGGGSGASASEIATAVWAVVPDAGAPTKARTFLEQWNILFSVDAGNADGLDGVVGSTKSLDATKHRSEFTVQAGKRTFTARDGD